MTIKPEAGKRYVMRNGCTTGVIALANTHAHDHYNTWDLSGKHNTFPMYDLVAVVAEEPEAYSEIIEKVNIAEAAFNAMVDQAEEDGRKVFIAEMEKALQDDLRRSTRARILDIAKEYVTKDRQATHGKPEDTFGLIAAYWSAHLDTNVTSADVAAMMCLLKLARAKQNPQHIDSWIDLAGYAACAGELVK